MSAGMSVKEIAAVAHEVNRAYCEGLGDSSQAPWGAAPDWQRESAIEGVKAHIEAGGLTPAKSHELWMARKVEEGWVWGPKKNPEKKKHPCMVPFDQLPQEQRVKDHLFAAVVRALAPR